MRTDRHEWADVLRRLLAPSLSDGMTADPNLSAWFGRQDGAVRDLAALYRHGKTCFRTARPARVVNAVLGYLDGYLPAPPGLMRIESWALLGADGVVLVHDFFQSRIRLHESVLRRAGYEVIDRAVQYLDPLSKEIVIPEPRLEFDADVLDELGGPGDDQRFHAGRYPVRALVQMGAGPDPVKVTSPARQLSSLAAFLDRPWHRICADELEIMGRLAAEVPVVRHLGEYDEDLLGILDQLSPTLTPSA